MLLWEGDTARSTCPTRTDRDNAGRPSLAQISLSLLSHTPSMADRISRPNSQHRLSCSKLTNPVNITQPAPPKLPSLPSPRAVDPAVTTTTATLPLTTFPESQTQISTNGTSQPTPPANPSQTRRQISRTLSESPLGPDQLLNSDPPTPRRNTVHTFGPDNPLVITESAKNHLSSSSGTDPKPSSARPTNLPISRNHRILGGSASSDDQAQTFNTSQFLSNERSWDAFTNDTMDADQWENFLRKYSKGQFDNIAAPPRPPGRWRGMIRYATRSAPASLRCSAASPSAPAACKANSDICTANSDSSCSPLAADMESDTVNYMQPPLPSDELERRRALYKFRILGTNPDIDFDRIVEICKEIFEVDICLISLVNIDTQWFKAEKGLGCRSTGRGESFCAHAILRKQDDPLVVLDAQEDWRFKNNPLVIDSPFIRFYAGAPLRTKEGYAIGTLCIIDSKPRTSFPKAKRDLLVKFASTVMHEIYLWSDRAHLKSFKLMHENFGQYQKLCLEAEQEQAPKGHTLLMSLDDRNRKNASMQHEFDVACRLIREGLDVDKVILAKIYPGSVVQSRWKGDGNGSAGDTKAETLDKETHTVVVCSDEDLSSSTWGTDDEPLHNTTVKHLEYHFDNAHRRSSSSVNSSSTLPNPPRLRFLSSNEGDEAPSYLSDHAILELLEQSPEVISLLSNGTQVNQGAIFQNNFPIFDSSGYCSGIVVPTISSSSSAPTMTKTGPLPFGVLIALTKNPIRQLEWEEMAYLYNFGVSIVSQVVKRSVVVADRAKSAFISGISHELRTPLHGILAVLELLIPPSLQSPLTVRQTPQTSDIFSQPVHPTQPNQCNYDPLTPTQSALLQTIESCGKSLISIINNVLDLAKLESGKRKVDTLECVSFIGLVEEVGEAMFGGVHSKSVEFLVSTEDEDEIVRLKDWRSQIGKRVTKGWRQRWVFKSDAGCLRQILLNLVGNALKFTTEGFVHLCVSRPTNVPCIVSGGVVKHPIMFTVSDSGCGISQTFMRNRLFQPFSQEDPLQQGTGLGLRICFELVEKMGGRIEVESSGVPGQGSVFRVLIWCEEELQHPAGKMSKVNEASQAIEGKTVRLLIDETKKIKKVLEKYALDLWALHLLKPEDPDEEEMVMLDDDIELLQAVLTNSSGQWKSKEPHILFITSLANHGTASAIVAQAREGSGYGGNVILVTTPVGPSKLLGGVYECFVSRVSTPLDVVTTAETAPLEDMMSDTTTTSKHSSVATPGEGSSGQRNSMSSDSYFPEHSTPQTPRTPKTLDSSVQNMLQEEHKDEHFESSLPSVQIDETQSSSPHHHPSRTVSYFDPHAIRIPPDTGLITPPGIELPSPYIYHRPQEVQNELQYLQQVVRRPSLPITLPVSISADTAVASLTQNRSKKHRSFPSTPEAPVNENDLSNSIRTSLPASGKTSPFASDATLPTDTPDPGSIPSTSSITIKSLVTPSPPRTPPPTPPVLPHVLIVEDNAVNRLILVTFLRKRGVSFLEAENGAIGVDLFQNEMTTNGGLKGFDVVLMDINMPVMNGNIATAEIRRIECENGILPEAKTGKVGPDPNRRRSIIYALTGLASAQDKRVAFECGVDGFLTKPVSLKVLADVLDNYFPNTSVSNTSVTVQKSPKAASRLGEK